MQILEHDDRGGSQINLQEEVRYSSTYQCRLEDRRMTCLRRIVEKVGGGGRIRTADAADMSRVL
jgi:hypothetical protein